MIIQGIKDVAPLIVSNRAAFSAAGKAMAELATAGCIGATCVHKELLTPNSIQALSKTTFSILLPMFLFTSVIKSVGTYGLSKSSLGVPILAVVQSFCLFIIAKKFLLPLVGIDPNTDEGRSTIVSCSWGNSGVVPLIFAEALFRHRPHLLDVAYGQVSLFLVGWSPFFWSFGRSVLIAEDNENDDTSTKGNSGHSPFRNLKRLFPPPVIGVMSGLLLAISPLRPLFYKASSSESNPLLGIIYNSFSNLGRAANPLALLVLTSSLALGANIGGGKKSSSSKEKKNTTTKTTATRLSSNETNLFLSRWTIVSIARFIISPSLMMILLKILSSLNFVKNYTDAPMLWFILLLQSCMPPAQNSVLMLQVADKKEEATTMAKFLFSMYSTAMIPVVIIVSIALRVFNLSE